MGNIIQGPGQDRIGLSQALWNDVPVDRIFGGKDRDVGWGLRDDFTNWASTIALSSGLTHYLSEGNLYRTYAGVGGGTSTAALIANTSPWTVAYPVYSPGGQALVRNTGDVVPTPGAVKFTSVTGNASTINMAVATDINVSSYSPGLFTPYPITSGVQGDVIFECRFMLSDCSVYDGFFIGLASTCAVSSSIPLGTAFSTTPGLLGFGRLYNDTAGTIGLVYNKAGGATVSQQSVSNMSGLNLLTMGGATGLASGTASPVVSVGGAGGIPSSVPTTYIGNYLRLGFRYSASQKTLTPFINGVAQTSKVIGSGSLSANLGSAAPGVGSSTLWPAAPMNFVAALYTSQGTDSLTPDWWQCVQLAG